MLAPASMMVAPGSKVSSVKALGSPEAVDAASLAGTAAVERDARPPALYADSGPQISPYRNSVSLFCHCAMVMPLGSLKGVPPVGGGLIISRYTHTSARPTTAPTATTAPSATLAGSGSAVTAAASDASAVIVNLRGEANGSAAIAGEGAQRERRRRAVSGV